MNFKIFLTPMINMKMLLCIIIFLVHLYTCLICIQVDFLNASRWQMVNSYKISLKDMKVRLWLHFWYGQSDRVLKCTIVLSTFVYYIFIIYESSHGKVGLPNTMLTNGFQLYLLLTFIILEKKCILYFAFDQKHMKIVLFL